MNEKRPGCQAYSIIFLIFSVLLYLPLIFSYPNSLKIIEWAKESQNPAAILVVIFYGIVGISGCFYIAIIAAIFGCLGAILSCFNLQCEEKKTRNTARILVAVNGVLAFALPVFYLLIKYVL